MEMERGRVTAHECEQGNRDGCNRKMRGIKVSQSQYQVESGAVGELPCGNGE